MTNYKKHLYNYTEIRKKSPNRKLLTQWITYITENQIPTPKIHQHIIKFIQNTPYMQNKTPTTKQNYTSELNNFTEYIYHTEGYHYETPAYHRNLSTKFIKGTIKNTTKSHDEGKRKNAKQKELERLSRWDKLRRGGSDGDVEVVVDDEYRDFLERYERLSRGGG